MAPDIRPLRESVAFRWLWCGDLFATLGRQIALVAIPVQIFTLTGSSLMVGLVSLFQFVPLIAGSLIGGVVADARDRRQVVMLAQTSMAAIGLCFVLNSSLTNPMVWPIFVLAALQSVTIGFDNPARRAALPSVVRMDLLTSALGLQQILGNLSKMVVPAFAGVLIAAFGVTFAFWVNAGCFVIALCAAYRLPPLRPQGGGRKAGWSSLVEGLQYTAKQPIVLSICLVDLSAMIFGLPRALFPAIGTEVLGGTAATVGLLYAAPGAGSLLGALTSGWLGRVHRIGRMIVVSIVFYGIAIIGFGLSHSLWLSLTFLALSGLADLISAILRSTLLQLSTPDHLRGRVSSVNKAVVGGGPLLGDTRAGTQAALSSAGLSVVSGGVACLVGLGLIVWRRPQLWHAVLHDGGIRDSRDVARPTSS